MPMGRKESFWSQIYVQNAMGLRMHSREPDHNHRLLDLLALRLHAAAARVEIGTSSSAYRNQQVRRDTFRAPGVLYEPRRYSRSGELLQEGAQHALPGPRRLIQALGVPTGW
jgi:hypothetical protein